MLDHGFIQRYCWHADSDILNTTELFTNSMSIRSCSVYTAEGRFLKRMERMNTIWLLTNLSFGERNRSTVVAEFHRKMIVTIAFSFMQFRNVMIVIFLRHLKKSHFFFFLTLQRLDQCYSDILQVKIKFVMIFIVSGMEDFQT